MYLFYLFSIRHTMKFCDVLVFSILLCSINLTSVGSSYGPGIYETLRGFVGEFANVIRNVSAGIEQLGRGIRNVEEFLDATVDEECIFECPNGEPYVPNPDNVPTTNGCGSFGLQDYLTADMLPLSEFVSCCDDHDICYETCGNDKDECDLKFKKCLYRKCSAQKESVSKYKHKGCQAGAKILYTGTTTLGCKPYINSQRVACICPKSARSQNTRDEF